MEPDIGQIEGIFKKRISLLRDLLDCVGRERDSLLNYDINGIWALVDEKNKILESLEKTKDHIKTSDINKPLLDDFSLREKRYVTELSQTLSDLKNEIRTRVCENISFINDTMNFFHELVYVMTTSGHAENAYGPSKNSRKESLNLLHHSEV